MNCEILAVGTELLLGNIANTNAQYLSQELSSLGVNVFFHSVVGDNPERLKSALELAFSRSDMVITTGGLGPTEDDLTKETAAEYFNEELICNEEALERIKAFFKRNGNIMVPSNEKQAYIPKNAQIFQNQNGTAPGFFLKKNGKILIMLPGPPSEMKNMFDNSAKELIKKEQSGAMFSREIRLYGIGESAAEAKLTELMKSSNPTLAPYAKSSEVMLRVTAKADTIEQAKKAADEMVSKVSAVVGEYIYGIDVSSLEEVAVKKLLEKKLTVSCAESCTGGYIAKRITDISGASEVFHCGVITYSNDMKEKLINVSRETLEKFGAVSEQTAIEMAEGVRLLSGAEIGVSATGIAGPGGGTEQKPVGLVYLGISSKFGTRFEKVIIGRGNHEREYVRYGAANRALSMIIKETEKF